MVLESECENNLNFSEIEGRVLTAPRCSTPITEVCIA